LRVAGPWPTVATDRARGATFRTLHTPDTHPWTTHDEVSPHRSASRSPTCRPGLDLTDKDGCSAETVQRLLPRTFRVQGVRSETEHGGPEQHLPPVGQMRPLLDKRGPRRI